MGERLEFEQQAIYKMRIPRCLLILGGCLVSLSEGSTLRKTKVGKETESLSALAIQIIGPGVESRLEEANYYAEKASETITPSSDTKDDHTDGLSASLQADMSFLLAQAAKIVALEDCEETFYSLGMENKGSVKLNLLSAKTCVELMKVSESELLVKKFDPHQSLFSLALGFHDDTSI